ncbi:hypothetical protein RHMOL_Rhmol06G0192200 [Rhododendron molle]|uniref:Uncharacterized protein n=1 Tax=Rhododendron molle TaxID=49168 RepID=A0ACC0NFK1_RHOML|nr:hypothetical protein RHMOL_Rhmol06G0192200 [Rhododendron molle]
MRRIVLCSSEPSDCASDGSDLTSAMNSSRSLVAEMKSEPSGARSEGSKVRSTVLCTSPLLISIPRFITLQKPSRAELNSHTSTTIFATAFASLRWEIMKSYAVESSQELDRVLAEERMLESMRHL